MKGKRNKSGVGMLRLKRSFAALASSALLFAGLAAPAAAQPIITGGLVNITIVDSLNNLITVQDVNLGVALNLAANVCGVNVNVLAVQLQDGTATCTTGPQTATIRQITG
jgi:hypothetical protein